MLAFVVISSILLVMSLPVLPISFSKLIAELICCSAQLKSLALMLISILTEASTFRQQSAAFLKAAKQLVPVLNFIHENLEDDLRREKMAGLIHLSSSAFHSLFKTAIGTSPGEYVQNLRIQKAQQLLISSNLTVNEISQKVGHRDPFHFSKIFKTRCGTSPSFYRDQVRKSLEKSPVKSS